MPPDVWDTSPACPDRLPRRYKLGSPLLRKAAACAVGCAPQGALPPRAKPLTCPDRNISIPPEKDSLRQQPSSYQRKLRDSFQENVESFVTHYGEEHCYSLLLTAKPTTPKGFSKCVNSAKTNLLRKLFIDEIDVIEATKRGSPHIHALVALPFACPNFPHDTLKRCRQAFRQGRHAHSQALWKAFLKLIPAELRDLWLLLQTNLPRYGLGKMIELVPLRETGRALACYYGKYLAKGFADRPADWKHVRLVRYPGARAHVPGGPKLHPKWKVDTALRSSAGPRGWLWRQRLAKLAAIYGVTEEDGGIASILGKRWGYHQRETINRLSLDVYSTGLHAQADGHDFWNDPTAPAPGDMQDVRITNSTGVREGYQSPMQTAWHCAERAARWSHRAKRFIERLSGLFCWAASFLRAAHVRQYKQGDFNGIHWTWRWKKGRVNQSTMGGFCPTCQTEFIITPRPNQYGGTDTTIFCTHCNSGFGIYNVANLHDHIARKIEGDIRSGRWKTIAKT